MWKLLVSHPDDFIYSNYNDPIISKFISKLEVINGGIHF